MRNVDTDCIIDLIRSVTPYHFYYFGSMHQCYDYDEESIVNLLKFEFKHLVYKYNILLK
jgi:hypothetical protein